MSVITKIDIVAVGHRYEGPFLTRVWDITLLLHVQVNRELFRVMTQFWNPTYNCFTFGNVDMMPTIEEYEALVYCPKIQKDKIYSRPHNHKSFRNKLEAITLMNEDYYWKIG
ncbi:hypothetical protein GQ457_03G000030 [Hibiscus cannabinus]